MLPAQHEYEGPKSKRQNCSQTMSRANVRRENDSHGRGLGCREHHPSCAFPRSEGVLDYVGSIEISSNLDLTPNVYSYRMPFSWRFVRSMLTNGICSGLCTNNWMVGRNRNAINCILNSILTYLPLDGQHPIRHTLSSTFVSDSLYRRPSAIDVCFVRQNHKL